MQNLFKDSKNIVVKNMSCNQKKSIKDCVIELSSCKKLLAESQTEFKVLNKDYIELVKKHNVILKEIESLRKENQRLRKIVYEGKDNY